MTKELRAELEAAGYTKAEIDKEAAYLARIERENDLIRYDRAWNYGLHHAEGC